MTRRPQIVILLACLLACPGAFAQDTSAPTPTAGPTPIPVPEITTQSSEVGTLLRQIESQLQPDPQIAEIATKLPEWTKTITVEGPAAVQTLDAQPPLDAIDALVKPWQERQLELTHSNELLTERAKQLEEISDNLSRLSKGWKATSVALAPDTPAAIVDRVRATMDSVRDAQKAVKTERGNTLTLQDGTMALLSTTDEVLQLSERARALVVRNLFSRDRQPIWQLISVVSDPSEVRGRLEQLVNAQASSLRDFVVTHYFTLLLHAIAILCLALVLFRARRRMRTLRENGESFVEIKILERPGASALVLGMLAVPWTYAQAPRVAHDLAALISVIPVLRLINHLTGRPLHPWAYSLAGFFVIDRVRAVIATATTAEQVLFLAEMLLATGLLIIFLRPQRLKEIEGEVGGGRNIIRAVALFLLACFVVAFAMSAIGFGQFGRLLGGGALRSLYVGVAFYAGSQAVEGVIGYALTTRPLRDLNIVARHGTFLFLRIQRVLRWVFIIAWATATLSGLSLLEIVVTGVRSLLGTTFTRGSLSVSLGDVIAFSITVWGSFALSRLVRFVLEEDVYPRLRVGHGIPYAMSRLVHYVLLTAGFFIATAMIGLDTSRLAFLVGAFGVGVGFGLQNVVNNFVSGIILLFERPIQVGDLIEMGALKGRVDRIGIRSSTVRVGNGAEVIVPNGSLIAESVTNWTLSDRARLVEIPVSVAPNADPAEVIALLQQAAIAHAEVSDKPAPSALFAGFGDNALKFSLKFWADDVDQADRLRSEVAVAISTALKAADISLARAPALVG